MESKSDKQLDRVIKKAMQVASVESPSLNFTSKVMSEIESTPSKALSIKYEPPIKKPVWVLLGFVLVVLLIASLLNEIEGFSFLGSLDYQIDFNAIGLSVSRITMYAFFFFFILFMVQVGLLKRSLFSLTG